MKTQQEVPQIPFGYCQCGCGRRTKISTYTAKRDGYVKGQPRLFLNGHSRRFRSLYAPEDRGYKTACWIWQGTVAHDGYGCRHIPESEGGRTTRRAHRWLYEQVKGPVPNDLPLDHLCNVLLCVNPDHMEPVTQAENCQRGKAARLTVEQVRDIRRRSDNGASRRSLAKEFGVAPQTILKIARRESWKNV